MTLEQETGAEQERIQCVCQPTCVCSCGPWVGVAVTGSMVGAIVGGGSAAYNAVVSNPVLPAE